MDRIKPVVVADAGSIIHLDELDCLDVLADFEKVYVSEAVWLEVLNHRPRALAAFSSQFVRKSPVKTSPKWKAAPSNQVTHRKYRKII